MHIEKYIFCLPKALELQQKRQLSSRKLSHTELFVLYACKRLPNATSASIFRYGIKYGAAKYRLAIHRALEFLLSQGLVEKENQSYNMTPEGRDLLSGIRRYLFNMRIN